MTTPPVAGPYERRAHPPKDGSFKVDGACRTIHHDLFYAERGADTSQAKAVCAECTVREVEGYANKLYARDFATKLINGGYRIDRLTIDGAAVKP